MFRGCVITDILYYLSIGARKVHSIRVIYISKGNNMFLFSKDAINS